MKNIVICCDGTGNEYGRNNTNVVDTYVLVEKDREQVAWYDPGVGTGGWEYNEEDGSLRAMADQATGHGLQKNVEDAYRYLMGSYEDGDLVYLFGFSRGAFTVRSLAGMLHKCGLLDEGHRNLVDYATKIYNTAGNEHVAQGFREAFGRRCPVHFIGVWDTVESLVLHAGKRFHDARLNPDVAYAYHALAIDEMRRDFAPFQWDEASVAGEQTVEQVWFAGCHSDVGGWFDERGLCHIALHWMLRKAVECGLRVKADELAERRTDPLDELHQSFTGFWKVRGRSKRQIPDGARIHASVFERLEDAASRYLPDNLPDDYIVVE